MQTLQIFLAILAIQSRVFAIYEGYPPRPHQFPYSVFVGSSRFFCGGAIISEKHILTAGHCLMTTAKGEKVDVIVGAHEYYGQRKSDGVKLSSSKFWIHENFTMPSAVFDIGLIELEEPLTFSDKIQPIGISTKKDADLDVDDQNVFFSAWGYTEWGDGVADHLFYTNMTLIPFHECENYKSHYVEDLNKDHICAVKIKGAPCDGDSGAALISSKTNKIVGILSYGKDAENGVDLHHNECGSAVPEVSTRVSSYIDWISGKTGLHFE